VGSLGPSGPQVVHPPSSPQHLTTGPPENVDLVRHVRRNQDLTLLNPGEVPPVDLAGRGERTFAHPAP
jgi:hypothetical protein